MGRYVLFGCVLLTAGLQPGCAHLDVATSAAEVKALQEIRTGQYELIRKDELSQLREAAEIGRSVGRFRTIRDGWRTWRLDTATGVTCLLLATESDWKKPDTAAQACLPPGFPPGAVCGHLEQGTAKTQHDRALKALAKAHQEKLEENPEVKPFEPYCLRHTALTNLAAAGCDAFTLARIAGHRSITITMRYCHPQADAIERAFAQVANLPKVVTDGGYSPNAENADEKIQPVSLTV